MVGVAASVLLHSFLLGALIYGTPSRRNSAPHQLGAGASAQLAGGVPAMTLVFIDQSVAPESAEEPQQDLASEGLKYQQ